MRYFVNFCNNKQIFAKVLKKSADIEIVRRLTERSTDMYMWPGCYSFRDEVGMFALWIKEQIEAIVLKVYELDRMLNS